MPVSTEETIRPAPTPAADRVRKFSFFNPERLDLGLALVYLLIYSIYFLGRNRHGYDEMHGVSLLVGYARLADGQVPFRDFFPWYGPLFSYFMAGWTWLLGRDLWAVGMFMHVVTPWLCYLALLAVTRWLRLDWPRRLLIVALALIFGVDRLFGATRSFLGLFLIGAWFAALGLPEKYRAWSRAAVFPSLLLIYFYSPEIGLSMAGVAAVFIVIDLAARPHFPDKIKTGLAYGAGIALTLTVFFILYRHTGWLRNYLRFSFYSSQTMGWAYSSPFPAPAEVWANLNYLPFYLYPLFLAGSAAWLLVKLATGRFAEVPPPFPVLLAYALALWPSSFFKCDMYHLLFALPPGLFLIAYLGLNPSPSRWKRGGLAVAAAAVFVLSHRASFWIYWDEFRGDQEIRNSTSPFSGIFVLPEITRNIEATRAFCAAHPRDAILFPLNSFEAYTVGRPFLWSFDDPFWTNDPVRRRLRMQQFQQLDPPYLVLWPADMFGIYTSEDTDELFDYIAAHYEPLPEDEPAAPKSPRDPGVIIYSRRPSPVLPVRLVQELPGPFPLAPENNFTVEWEIPPGFSHGYLEMREKFFYRPAPFQRLSKPFVRTFVSGRRSRLWISNGREAIRSSAEGGSYRVYLPPNVDQVTITIVFPGGFNPAPEKVEISGVRFQQFNFEPSVPYTSTFLGRGY